MAEGMYPKLHLCDALITSNPCAVALNEGHLQQLMLGHALPPLLLNSHHLASHTLPPAVALNEGHLQELMLEHAVPPPAPPGSSSVSLVRMGFPSRNPEAPGAAAFTGEAGLWASSAAVCS